MHPDIQLLLCTHPASNAGAKFWQYDECCQRKRVKCMGRNIWAATGYDRLSGYRVGASQQPQDTRVSRQLQGETILAATECEYLGISLGVTIFIWQ